MERDDAAGMKADLSVCSNPSYDVSVSYNTGIPLRGGVRLAADIYHPALGDKIVEKPMPAILIRTPYNKVNLSDYRYFAERGYVVVIQDVRGRYASEGIFYPFVSEGTDGYDTIEWIASQPWCNGSVGTTGSSYAAAAQSAAASLDPPGLRAMIPIFGPSSYFHCSMRHNGAFEMLFVVYAFNMAATSREAAADPHIKRALEKSLENIWDWVRSYPVRKGDTPLTLVPSYEQWLIDVSTHSVYDDYWHSPGYGPRPFYDRHADVPTLYIGGWYDIYSRATLENFVELGRRQKKPVHALMGPWTHSGYASLTAGDISTAPEGSAPDIHSVELRWFDHWLKGLPTGIQKERSLKYFLMGGGKGPQTGTDVILHGGRWKSSDTWPPEGAEPVCFYLQPGGGLAATPPICEDSSTSYRFDPSNPVPTIGGNLAVMPLPAGGFNQKGDDRFIFSRDRLSLSSRDDVVCFITEPLGGDMAIAGPLFIHLWVSTDGSDTDFTAKLIDVYPPSTGCPEGVALNLTDGIMRLRFHEGFEKESQVKTGEIYDIFFEMYPTANLFLKGHRVRLDISSSNYPRFDINSNTGGVLGVDRGMRIAVNTVYHNSARPSCITICIN
jgi:uncharacterized protein